MLNLPIQEIQVENKEKEEGEGRREGERGRVSFFWRGELTPLSLSLFFILFLFSLLFSSFLLLPSSFLLFFFFL